MADFEVFKREDGRWAWRLVAANGRIVATDGGQGYENEADADATGRRVVSGGYADAVSGDTPAG